MEGRGFSGGFSGRGRGSSTTERSDWRSRDYGDSGSATSFYIEQKDVGRIIGKGGSKIRDLQSESGANIKVYSRDVQHGEQVKVEITGDQDSQMRAKDLIDNITLNSDGYGDRSYGGDRGGGYGYSNGNDYRGGGGGYGGRRGGGGSGGGGSRTCYKCGEEGHISRDCPDGGRGGGSGGGSGGGGGGGGGSRSCYKCGEEGHISRDCPENAY